MVAQDRLRATVIDCLPWDELLSRYDRPDALVYLDPPHYACGTYYGPGLFSRDDHARRSRPVAWCRSCG